MNIIEKTHKKYIYGRRINILAKSLSVLLLEKEQVLDVGSGDGLLAKRIMQDRGDVQIHGLDILWRDQTHIPVKLFDGNCIPYDDRSVDVVMLVDVLHHTKDPIMLLKESKRVARRAIILKDHICDGFLAIPVLKFMDSVGNERHGVTLPYNYWSSQQWYDTFDELALSVSVWKTDLSLYPTPISWIFDRSLHFIARLECPNEQTAV